MSHVHNTTSSNYTWRQFCLSSSPLLIFYLSRITRKKKTWSPLKTQMVVTHMSTSAPTRRRMSSMAMVMPPTPTPKTCPWLPHLLPQQASTMKATPMVLRTPTTLTVAPIIMVAMTLEISSAATATTPKVAAMTPNMFLGPLQSGHNKPHTTIGTTMSSACSWKSTSGFSSIMMAREYHRWNSKVFMKDGRPIYRGKLTLKIVSQKRYCLRLKFRTFCRLGPKHEQHTREEDEFYDCCRRVWPDIVKQALPKLANKKKTTGLVLFFYSPTNKGSLFFTFLASSILRLDPILVFFPCVSVFWVVISLYETVSDVYAMESVPWIDTPEQELSIVLFLFFRYISSPWFYFIFMLWGGRGDV